MNLPPSNGVINMHEYWSDNYVHRLLEQDRLKNTPVDEIFFEAASRKAKELEILI